MTDKKPTKRTIGLTVDKMEEESQAVIKGKNAKDVTPKAEKPAKEEK